jgi:hypothetical protein
VVSGVSLSVSVSVCACVGVWRYRPSCVVVAVVVVVLGREVLVKSGWGQWDRKTGNRLLMQSKVGGERDSMVGRVSEWLDVRRWATLGGGLDQQAKDGDGLLEASPSGQWLGRVVWLAK